MLRQTDLLALLLFTCSAGSAPVDNLSYGATTMPARSISATWAGNNVIPQAAGVLLTYSGTLDNAKWLSLVDATYNSVHDAATHVEVALPCSLGTVAAAGADSTHSGSLRAVSGTKVVTIPQSTLLDETKTYAVCYAVNDGTSSDTWSDTRCARH